MGKPSLLAKLLLALAVLTPASARAQTPDDKPVMDIEGFRVDFSRIERSTIPEILPGYVIQIRQIEAANLPAPMLKLMREIPIIVDPKKPQKGSHALFTSKYNSGRGGVFADLRSLPEDRPILLHEMIHAWDWNRYSFANPTIVRAYAQAKSSGVFPDQTSHFMENQREYFAISSTIYLTGRSDQPPFNCRKLANSQPEYIGFLQRLYGEHGFCRQTVP